MKGTEKISSNKELRKNLISLLIFQGISLLIPLATLPYLARVLGVVQFGMLGLAMAITQYFLIFVDYGFNLSATAKIAKASKDRILISECFYTTMVCKAILFTIGLISLTLGILFIPKINDISLLLLISYLTVFGNLLFPIWFLQGVQKMHVIAISSLVAKVTTLPLIFILVKGPEDIFLVALIQGGVSILSGILALTQIYKLQLLIKVYVPTYKDILNTMGDGWHYFVSSSAISLYTNTNLIVLGLMSNSMAIGYFAGIDKIKSAMLSILSPFTQAIYPKVNSLFQENKRDGFNFVAKYLLRYSIVGLLYSITIYLFSPIIVRILLGESYIPAVINLKILAFLPLLIVINSLLGTHLLLPLGMKKSFMHIIISCGLIHIVVLIPLVYFFDDIGASISIIVTECIVTAMMIAYIIKKFPFFYNEIRSQFMRLIK